MMDNASQAWRWCGCFALALGLHIAGGAALLARLDDDADQTANAPVVMIDLAPIAVAPTTTPTEQPPDQVASKQQLATEPAPEKPQEVVTPEPEPVPDKPVEVAKPEAEPEIEKPDEVPEVMPDPVAQPDLAVLPPPRPVQKPVEAKPVEKKKVVQKPKPPRQQASLAAAPSPADNRADRAAAPTPGAMRDTNALPNWTSRLIAQLERNKRYPAAAQARGDRGVVRLAFSVDRGGGVHNARVVGSSGSSALDQETLAMVERASPLPAPPNEVPGARVSIVVPIRYSIR